MSPWRKKARLLKAYLRGLPVFCSWQVTYVCNYRCRFCDYWKEEVNYSEDARRREASLDDFRQGSAKLAEIGSLLISLAGGEPFMRRDLAEIVAVVARDHFPLLTTNGSLVSEQRAKELWRAGLWGISVSLDSNNPERHDANRGSTGAAERARRALRVLSSTRTRRYQRVSLLCVLADNNLDDLEPLIRFAADNHCDFLLQPYVSFKTGKAGPVLPPAVSEHLLALKGRYSNFVSNPYFLSNFDRFCAGRGVPDCKAGRAFFNLDNFLNVQKCVEFREEPVGNLRDLTADELVRRLHHEYERNKCAACWYNCRGEVEALYSLKGLLASAPILLR